MRKETDGTGSARDPPAAVHDPKKRDDAICSVARICASINHLLLLGLFSTYAAAQRRVAKLEKEGRLHRVGDIRLGSTKRTSLYSTRESVANLLHEYWITACTLFAWPHVIRGKMLDEHIQPDATILLAGVEVDVEVDLDTEGYEQIRQKLKKYRDADRYNLWFAPTKTRLEGIGKYATPRSLFSVLGSGVLFDLSGIEVKTSEIFDRARRVAFPE
jgi:hypothetical protein